MDDGEEEMGFDAFPCIISTGFSLISVQVWFLFSTCTCTAFVLGWLTIFTRYLSLKSGTRLLAGFPALVEFHKT